MHGPQAISAARDAWPGPSLRFRRTESQSQTPRTCWASAKTACGLGLRKRGSPPESKEANDK